MSRNAVIVVGLALALVAIGVVMLYSATAVILYSAGFTRSGDTAKTIV